MKKISYGFIKYTHTHTHTNTKEQVYFNFYEIFIKYLQFKLNWIVFAFFYESSEWTC
jgi:hypothetical protein